MVQLILNRGGWLFGILLFLSSPLFACTVTDDMGNVIQLKKPAQRIITLAPDITETFFAIGAGDRIIGTVDSSDYPVAAKKIPRVGSYSGIDLERIASMHPDLIVVWSNTFARQISVLKKIGIPVYVTQPKHLEDVARSMKNFGYVTDLEKNANQKSAAYLQQLKVLREQQTQKPVTVFYQIGSYSLMTINRDSWINQAIELCGGRNIFADAKFIAPEVSWESVVSANPQVIISDARDTHWQERWQRWPQMQAVQQHRLYTINPDLIDRAGPRLVDGVAQLCGRIGGNGNNGWAKRAKRVCPPIQLSQLSIARVRGRAALHFVTDHNHNHLIILTISNFQ